MQHGREGPRSQLSPLDWGNRRKHLGPVCITRAEQASSMAGLEPPPGKTTAKQKNLSPQAQSAFRVRARQTASWPADQPRGEGSGPEQGTKSEKRAQTATASSFRSGFTVFPSSHGPAMLYSAPVPPLLDCGVQFNQRRVGEKPQLKGLANRLSGDRLQELQLFSSPMRRCLAMGNQHLRTGTGSWILQRKV